MLRHHNNELNWKSHELKKQQHSQNRVIENLIHVHQYFDLDNVKEHQWIQNVKENILNHVDV